MIIAKYLLGYIINNKLSNCYLKSQKGIYVSSKLQKLKDVLQENNWIIKERVMNVAQYFTIPLDDQLLSDHPKSDECETYYDAAERDYVLYDKNNNELLSGSMSHIRSYLLGD